MQSKNKSKYLRKLKMMLRALSNDLFQMYNKWVEEQVIISECAESTSNYKNRQHPVPVKMISWLDRIENAESSLKKMFSLVRKAMFEAKVAEVSYSDDVLNKCRKTIQNVLYWSPHEAGMQGVRDYSEIRRNDQQRLEHLKQEIFVASNELKDMQTAFEAWSFKNPQCWKQLYTAPPTIDDCKYLIPSKSIWPNEQYSQVGSLETGNRMTNMNYSPEEAVKVKQGFPANWWGSSDMSRNWKTPVFPIFNSEESHQQWAACMQEIVDYTYAHLDDNGQAEQLKQAMENDRTLISFHAQRSKQSRRVDVKSKVRKRDRRDADILKVQQELIKFLNEKNRFAKESFDANGISEILAAPTQKSLAEKLKMSESTLSRILSDKHSSAKIVQQLWALANEREPEKFYSDYLKYESKTRQQIADPHNDV